MTTLSAMPALKDMVTNNNYDVAVIAPAPDKKIWCKGRLGGMESSENRNVIKAGTAVTNRGDWRIELFTVIKAGTAVTNWGYWRIKLFTEIESVTYLDYG